MRTFERLVIAVALTIASCALADAGSKQTVKSTVKLNGFDNDRVKTGFKSTDAESWRNCTTGFAASCTASNSYDFPPKKINEYVCFPRELRYQVSNECASLLATSAKGCHSPSLPKTCDNNVILVPHCQWKTEKTGDAEWEWTITSQAKPGEQPYLIGCRKTGFSGVH